MNPLFLLFITALVTNNLLSFSQSKPDPIWSVWKRVDGQNSAIRDHLQLKHELVYWAAVANEHLKGFEALLANAANSTDSANSNRNPQDKPFTLDGFIRRLVRWIAVDDQVRPSLLIS